MSTSATVVNTGADSVQVTGQTSADGNPPWSRDALPTAVLKPGESVSLLAIGATRRYLVEMGTPQPA